MKSPQTFKTLADWLQWLQTLSPREIVLGLERVKELLARLDIDYPSYVFLVGGTNGKGSSVAMLEALLLEAGLSTACYTSPHVRRYNERMRVNAVAAADVDIIRALRRVDDVRGDVPLTFFEFGTLAALVHFDSVKVDAWVLEVGLGGRLDAVNAVEPDVSLITNVSLDHCTWLGPDVESIAREKAGIMRAGKPVVLGDGDTTPVLRDCARALGSELIVAGEAFSFTDHGDADGGWSFSGREMMLEALDRPPMRGDIQVSNAAAVLAVIEAAGLGARFNSRSINAALAKIDIAGRFQVIERECVWIFDVAHNPAAAQEQARRLRDMPRNGKTICVLGLLRDKDLSGIIAPITEFVDQWIAVPVAGPRGMKAAAVATRIADLLAQPCLIATDIGAALREAQARSVAGDTILVTGSFQVVGPALAWFDSGATNDQ